MCVCVRACVRACMRVCVCMWPPLVDSHVIHMFVCSDNIGSWKLHE